MDNRKTENIEEKYQHWLCTRKDNNENRKTLPVII